MKKIFALLLVVCLAIPTLATVACDRTSNADPSAIEYKDYTLDKTQAEYGALALVNSTHEYKFPAEASKNLANIWEYRTAHTEEGQTAAYKTGSSTLMLDGAALSSLHEWLTALNKATGESNVIISAAYRTYEDQKPFSIPQGQSDHHSGFGVTLKLYDGTITTDIFSNPEAYAWLADNAHKYGFVVRYPEDKSAITGISDYIEYFHYVGNAPAKYMHDNNLCLEEFVAQIKSYTQDKPLEVTDAGGEDWLIYYATCQGDMATVKLPTNFTYTVSGDNEGGIIVCVSLSKTAYEQQQQGSESDTAAQ